MFRGEEGEFSFLSSLSNFCAMKSNAFIAATLNEYFSWPFLLHVDLFPQFFSECRVYIKRLKPWVLAIFFILPFTSILRFLNPAIQKQSRRDEGAVCAFAPTLFETFHNST